MGSTSRPSRRWAAIGPASMLVPAVRYSSRRRAGGLMLGAVLLVVAACTSSPNDGAADIRGLVEIGDGRSLFVDCRGSGSPTVILMAGKGNNADEWGQVLDPADPAHDAPGDDVLAGMGTLERSDAAVLPQVARFTRVCAYDRPDTRLDDTDASTSRPQPHTVDVDVADLQSLLAAIGGGPPYVLVAHSYSGFVATLFTRTHPGAVGGLVMIDAGTERIADVLSPAQLTNWDETNRATSPELREGVEVIDAFARINAAPSMPDVPAIVMSADKGYRVDLLPPELATSDDMVTFADWSAAQELLARQLDAEHLTDTNSGHNIYLYEPDLVVRSIRQVVEEVRTAPSG